MTEIKLRSYIGEDGILHLNIPSEFRKTDVDVTVIVKAAPENTKTPEKLGWSSNFFEEVIGGWQGEALVRGEQGEYPISSDRSLGGAFGNRSN